MWREKRGKNIKIHQLSKTDAMGTWTQPYGIGRPPLNGPVLAYPSHVKIIIFFEVLYLCIRYLYLISIPF
jgi:hypothetical protein